MGVSLSDAEGPGDQKRDPRGGSRSGGLRVCPGGGQTGARGNDLGAERADRGAAPPGLRTDIQGRVQDPHRLL